MALLRKAFDALSIYLNQNYFGYLQRFNRFQKGIR
jgi:hypothetical protein